MSDVKIQTSCVMPARNQTPIHRKAKDLPEKPVSFLRNGVSKQESLEARVKQLKESDSPGYAEWVKTRPCGSAVGTWGDGENQWRNGGW